MARKTKRKPDAVLDTNVGLDIYSWHNLLDIGDKLLKEAKTEADKRAVLRHPDLQVRAQRMRHAFFLALFFDHNKWHTLVALNELMRKIRDLVPLTDAALSNYARMQTYFVRGKLLRRWKAGGNIKSDKKLVGNAVDGLCLDWADKHKIPLISCETNPKKLIPKQAKARGIDLATPEAFLKQQNFDGPAAAQTFLADWDAKTPAYLKQTPTAAHFLPLARDLFQRFALNDWDP
jgi:hypothetical protein